VTRLRGFLVAYQFGSPEHQRWTGRRTRWAGDWCEKVRSRRCYHVATTGALVEYVFPSRAASSSGRAGDFKFARVCAMCVTGVMPVTGLRFREPLAS